MNHINNSTLISNKEVDKMMRGVESLCRRYLKPSLHKNTTIKFVDDNKSKTSFCQMFPSAPYIEINVSAIKKFQNEGVYSKKEFILGVEGVLYHEIGHLLFTNFNYVNRHLIGLNKKKQIMVNKAAEYSEESNPTKKAELKKEVMDILGEVLFSGVVTSLMNIFEDGYIENTMKKVNKRASTTIFKLRQAYAKEQVVELNKNIAPWLIPNYEIFMRNVIGELHLAVTTTNGGIYSDNTIGEGYKEVLSNYMTEQEAIDLMLITQYVRRNAQTTEDVVAATNVVIDTIKPAYLDMIHKIDDRFEEMIESYESLKEQLENEMEKIGGENGETSPEDTYIPPNISISESASAGPTSDGDVYIPENLMDKINQKYQEEKEEEKKAQESESNDSDKQDSEESNSGESGESSDSSSDSNGEEGESEGESTDGKSEDKNSEGSDDSSEGESGEGESKDSDSKEGSGSDDEKDGESGSASAERKDSDNELDDKEGGSSGSLKDSKEALKDALDSTSSLDKAQEKDAEDEIMREEEAQKRAIQQKMAADAKTKLKGDVNDVPKGGGGKRPERTKGISGGDGMNDFPAKFHDTKDISLNVDGSLGSFESLKRSLENEASKIAVPLKKVLMQESLSKVQTGLKRGNQVNPASMTRARTDRRVFKKVQHGKTSTARIAVLIDCSGSMSGDAMEQARRGAYMLAKTLQRIRVPFQIWGHNTSWTSDSVNIIEAVSFEESYKSDIAEEVFKLEAGGANHDSIPIYRLGVELAAHKKKDEELFLWVISDGAPAGLGRYQGDAAERDIKSIVNNLKKMYNVNTFGIGIGNYVDSVPRIYKDNIIVSDVSQLGTELVNQIRKAIL